MSLKRILKLLAAFLAGQGVSVAAQLLVPPLFLHRYAHGLELYGEWLALTAAVSYLGTLNYGIQNYANNQMAIHYHRGEMEAAKDVQACALRLVLIVIAALLLLGGALLLMPVGLWMGLRHITPAVASITLLMMILQFLVSLPFIFLADSYMVVGEAHRGQLWLNAQRLFAVLLLSLAVWQRASFPVLAATQLGAMLLFAVLVLVDVRGRAPILLPSLRYGSTRQMIAQLRPTGHFALLSVSSFLVWQGPLLVIEKVLGPSSVAVFAMSRTIFSMCRQLLAVASYSIGQDITRLVGERNWPQLRRLYELSEKVVLFLIPSTMIGTLLLSPVLFSLWLHQRSLYQPGMCMMMAAISAVIGIKEHKWQFQWSSNQHESLARFNLGAYAAMLLVSALLTRSFGINAFLDCWLATELCVLAFIMHLNKRLFPAEFSISIAPIFCLFAILTVGFALAAWPVWHNANWPPAVVVGDAIAFAAMLATVCYFCFGLGEVRLVIWTKVRSYLQAAS